MSERETRFLVKSCDMAKINRVVKRMNQIVSDDLMGVRYHCYAGKVLFDIHKFNAELSKESAPQFTGPIEITIIDAEPAPLEQDAEESGEITPVSPEASVTQLLEE